MLTNIEHNDKENNMNARDIAFKVLLDIEKNKNYSNMSINKHFKDDIMTKNDLH